MITCTTISPLGHTDAGAISAQYEPGFFGILKVLKKSAGDFADSFQSNVGSAFGVLILTLNFIQPG